MNFYKLEFLRAALLTLSLSPLLLCGCEAEYHSSGIGGDISPLDNDIVYFPARPTMNAPAPDKPVE